jgi:hypothetical protein
MIPFLCIKLGVLPSQLYQEDYNEIANIVSAIHSQNELERKQARKSNR